MDKMIKGLINEFCDKYNFENNNDSKNLEHLVDYLIAARIQPEAVDDHDQINMLNVDSGSTWGIDGVEIFINNNLLVSNGGLETYEKSRLNDVHYIFIQTKTSERLDSGDIAKLFLGVQNFFEKSKLNKDENWTQGLEISHRIWEEMYNNTSFLKTMSKDSPYCSLYYVYTGKYLDERGQIENQINLQKKNLEKACTEIKNVEFNIIDANKILQLYRDIENQSEIELKFKELISIVDDDNINQSYYGVLNGKEFIKLIQDDEGKLKRNVFYENVRDYLGDDNSVNKGIICTVLDENDQKLFPILNNGITIIANYVKMVKMDDLIIKGYQIVNGCQSSNVIFRNQKFITDLERIKIPIKLIETDDAAIREKIIKANNKQSVVPDEAFIALSEFHKNLQNYYTEMAKTHESLYYERRSKEISNNTDLNISSKNIITLHAQIRSYISVYLNKPYLVYANNPAFILQQNNKKLFQREDSYALYYVSSYLVHKIRKFVSNNKYKQCLFYIAFLYRTIVMGGIGGINRADNKKCEQEKEKIIKTIQDKKVSKKILKECKKIIDEVSEKDNFKQFTIKELRSMSSFQNSIDEAVSKLLYVIQ